MSTGEGRAIRRVPLARREKAVREALSLLDRLCRDSLDVPLALAQTHPEQGEISATYARLAWLIEELSV